MSDELKQACADILDQLMKKHGCIQVECKDFGIFNESDAMELVADLIEMIQYSEEIEEASKSIDFGK